MDRNLIKRTNLATKYTLIFTTLSKGLGFFASVALVRALSEHEFGIYSLLYSVIGMIGMVASLGIENTLQRFIPEYYQKGEFKIAHKLYQTVSFLRLITNILILGALLLFWQEVAPYLKLTAYKHYFMLFTLVVFLHMQRNLLETCLASHFLHKYSKGIGLVFPAVKALGYGMIILFEKNLWYAIVTDMVAYTVIFIALQTIYLKKIPLDSGTLAQFTPIEKKRIKTYALFYNFNETGAGLLSASFDNFLIVLFANPVAVGAYSFCYQIIYLIESLFPLTYLADVVRPAFFASCTSSSRNDPNFYFKLLIKINYLFSVPCLFFILLFGRDIISVVYNDKFIEYSHILSGIFFFTVVSSFAFPVNLLAQLKEKANIILYSKIFAVYNLIAALILIKPFGLWGALFATETATLGKNLFIWYFVREEGRIADLSGFFLKLLSFWLLLSGGVYALNAVIPQTQTLLELILGILIFGVAFISQFKYNYFSPMEKNAFIAMASENSKLTYLLKWCKLA